MAPSRSRSRSRRRKSREPSEERLRSRKEERIVYRHDGRESSHKYVKDKSKRDDHLTESVRKLSDNGFIRARDFSRDDRDRREHYARKLKDEDLEEEFMNHRREERERITFFGVASVWGKSPLRMFEE
uniref:Uncharacterized protein n=1 Tax=Rhodnius prolixus TaxID=13249 RepID=T1IB48_RHOPR